MSVRSVVVLLAALLQSGAQTWEESFSVDKGALASSGSAAYYSLVPGAKSEFEGGGTRLVITVLDRTKLVDGVQTRVVEEREWEDGELVEVSLNYFAIEPKSGDVYYFGDDVDVYQGGKVSGHEGAWQSGKGGARFGLMMPGSPTVGRAFYQEVAKGVAMDRARIVSLDATVTTPSKTYEHCVKTEETTPLERGAKEYKFYAPGVGLVQDAEVKLVRTTR